MIFKTHSNVKMLSKTAVRQKAGRPVRTAGGIFAGRGKSGGESKKSEKMEPDGTTMQSGKQLESQDAIINIR